jgi:hypothetical protein
LTTILKEEKVINNPSKSSLKNEKSYKIIVCDYEPIVEDLEV